jgi:anti-anti-sigma factor
MTLEARNGDRRGRPAFGFHISTATPEDGIVEISAAGELDLATSGLLRETVDVCCERDGVRVLIVDLRDLTFVDSTGLRALWHARERAQSVGAELILRSPSPAMQHLLSITKLNRVFAVTDPQDD